MRNAGYSPAERSAGLGVRGSCDGVSVIDSAIAEIAGGHTARSRRTSSSPWDRAQTTSPGPGHDRPPPPIHRGRGHRPVSPTPKHSPPSSRAATGCAPRSPRAIGSAPPARRRDLASHPSLSDSRVSRTGRVSVSASVLADHGRGQGQSRLAEIVAALGQQRASRYGQRGGRDDVRTRRTLLARLIEMLLEPEAREWRRRACRHTASSSQSGY